MGEQESVTHYFTGRFDERDQDVECAITQRERNAFTFDLARCR
jgi:hypothetical protein